MAVAWHWPAGEELGGPRVGGRKVPLEQATLKWAIAAGGRIRKPTAAGGARGLDQTAGCWGPLTCTATTGWAGSICRARASNRRTVALYEELIRPKRQRTVRGGVGPLPTGARASRTPGCCSKWAHRDHGRAIWCRGRSRLTRRSLLPRPVGAAVCLHRHAIRGVAGRTNRWPWTSRPGAALAVGHQMRAVVGDGAVPLAAESDGEEGASWCTIADDRHLLWPELFLRSKIALQITTEGPQGQEQAYDHQGQEPAVSGSSRWMRQTAGEPAERLCRKIRRLECSVSTLGAAVVLPCSSPRRHDCCISSPPGVGTRALSAQRAGGGATAARVFGLRQR